MKFKVFRDWLQQTIYKIINPIVHGMIKIGITPNFITTTGLILNIVAACIFLYAGMKGERGDFNYIGWGGGIILFAGLFDKGERHHGALAAGRSCYVHLVRGTLHVNGLKLTGGDAALLENEPHLTLDAGVGAEVLVFDLAQ